MRCRPRPHRPGGHVVERDRLRGERRSMVGARHADRHMSARNTAQVLLRLRVPRTPFAARSGIEVGVVHFDSASVPPVGRRRSYRGMARTCRRLACSPAAVSATAGTTAPRQARSPAPGRSRGCRRGGSARSARPPSSRRAKLRSRRSPRRRTRAGRKVPARPADEAGQGVAIDAITPRAASAGMPTS